MIPGPAQYLLRIDDLCPTVFTARWRELEALIAEFNLKPILAVIPENADDTLHTSPCDPEFWAKMRTLEAAGATIALHGYRHLCESRDGGILGLHCRTEFAGVAEETQRTWMRAGLRILRGQGLNPRVWVAPRHGFDKATLRVLREEGIGVLSDGFARVPVRRNGLIWIPQQLWSPVRKGYGLWTICVHVNTLSASATQGLRAFLQSHAAQFTSVDRVLEEWHPGKPNLFESLRESLVLWRKRATFARNRSRRGM